MHAQVVVMMNPQGPRKVAPPLRGGGDWISISREIRDIHSVAWISSVVSDFEANTLFERAYLRGRGGVFVTRVPRRLRTSSDAGVGANRMRQDDCIYIPTRLLAHAVMRRGAQRSQASGGALWRAAGGGGARERKGEGMRMCAFVCARRLENDWEPIKSFLSGEDEEEEGSRRRLAPAHVCAASCRLLRPPPPPPCRRPCVL